MFVVMFVEIGAHNNFAPLQQLVFELNYTTFKTRRGQKSKINLFGTRRSAIPVPNNNP